MYKFILFKSKKFIVNVISYFLEYFVMFCLFVRKGLNRFCLTEACNLNIQRYFDDEYAMFHFLHQKLAIS